ncbi:MAG: sugar phosphate isomerase/epimerase [Planctomycetota bacterium]
MAIKLSLNTSTIQPQPLLEKIRLSAEAGFDGVELWLNDVYEHVGRGGEIREVERALSDHGLSVPCVVAVRAWAEATPEEYPIALGEVRRRMELCARLGSPFIVATPPRGPCSKDQIVERYRDLLRIGRECGVRPTFEYISFFQSCSRLSDAWSVVQSADEDDATLVVDAFHSFNSHSTLEDLRAIPLERISHYHIDDADPAIPAGRQIDADRVLPGDGPIPLRGEIQILKDKGYDGFVSLELFHPDLWQRDPADLLRKGIGRLRDLGL